MQFFPQQQDWQHATIRDLVEDWESSELCLWDIQSRIEQTLNMALMYPEKELKDQLLQLVSEKNSLLKYIEEVIFHLRQKAKQMPQRQHS